MRREDTDMSNHDRATDAVDLLNDFIGDLVTGVMAFREYDQQYRAGHIPWNMMVAIQKMCLSHLILTLAKWLEVHKRYHDIFSSDTAPVCRELNKEIRRREIPEFRNKCIGHIWDKNTGKPLLQSEIMERLGRVTDGSLWNFLAWLNDPNDNSYPNTVVGIVEKIRNDLASEYGLSPSDVIDR